MKVILTPLGARLSLRRNIVLALSLAAGIALQVGLPSAALAITEAQRATLAQAATNVDLDMRAAISTVLNQKVAAQERPLEAVLQDLAAALLELGATNELKAEYANALVAAANQFSTEAGEAAAEAVLVQAQESPALLSAIFADAAALTAADTPELGGALVLSALVAASTSGMISEQNQLAVRQAAITEGSQSANLQTGATTPFGAGPNLRGMTLVTTYSGGPGRGGNRVLEVVAGPALSPD